jgi:PAS domain S-box-containing protein
MDRGAMVQTVARDITARRKAEEALADSERRLSDIIEFLPDPTWVIDLDGRVVAWNKAVERMTGVKKKAILGKGGYAHAIPFYGEPRPTLIDLVLQRDRQWETNYLSFEEEDGLLLVGESFHPKMGEEGRFLSATAAKLYDAQGDVVGAVESVRDITAAKLAERDRERLIADLQGALAEVRTLSGLLPICAKCKNIRDDRGYWNQIESYITKHSKAEFSHSICPDCAKALYPDLHMQLK